MPKQSGTDFYQETIMKSIRNIFSTLALVGITLLFSVPVLAQQSGEPGNGGPAPAATTAVPVDGGASLLLVAGIGYGIKKVKARRKAKADAARAR